MVVDLDVSDNPRVGAGGTEALCVVLPPSFAAEAGQCRLTLPHHAEIACNQAL